MFSDLSFRSNTLNLANMPKQQTLIHKSSKFTVNVKNSDN